MQGAWHVVEVYCFFSIAHVLLDVVKYHNKPVLLALDFGFMALVLFLARLTFHANRLASRILAVLIVSNAVGYAWINVAQQQKFDIYLAYQMIIQVYLLAGAVMLWRIKELPTRFTDPPAEAPPHA